MKQWHWLSLELLILFGTTTWIYFFPDEAEVNLAKGAFGFALIYFIETVRKETNEEKEIKMTDEESEKEIKELQDKLNNLSSVAKVRLANWQKYEKENKELKDKLNKLLKFTLSYVECCDVCPETKTCHNSEGVCPYAQILQQDEDKVTHDWLLEFLNEKE